MTAPCSTLARRSLRMLTPAVLLACAGAAAAADQTKRTGEQRIDAAMPPITRTLIAPDLSARQVAVLEWNGGQIRYADEHGVERTAAQGEVLALAPGWWTPQPGRADDEAAASLNRDFVQRGWSGAVRLTDGQRLIGRPVPSGAAEPDHFLWHHPRLGVLQVSLESASNINMGIGAPSAGPARRTAAAGIDDELVLVNNDRLGGLVASVGSTVVVESADGGPELRIPIDRISEIRLANPPTRASGTVLWFDDGTVVNASSVEARERAGGASVAVRSTFPRSPDEGVWRLDELQAVVFNAAGVLSLASLEIASQGAAPGDRRRIVPPAQTLGEEPSPLWAADIELPGPMTVEWTLPEGATHAGGWVELPEECWTWGDCEVSIAVEGGRDGPRELWRRRINADRPLARFDVQLEPRRTGSLRITVEPGEHGPIQDRIVLRRVLIATTPR